MFQAKHKYCPVYIGVLLYSSVYGLHVPVLLASSSSSSSRFWTVFLSETWTPKISSLSFLWHFVRDTVDVIFLPNIRWCRLNLHVQHNENLARTAAELLNWTILQYLSLTHLTSAWFSKFCIWCFQSVVWAWSWLHIPLFYLTGHYKTQSHSTPWHTSWYLVPLDCTEDSALRSVRVWQRYDSQIQHADIKHHCMILTPQLEGLQPMQRELIADSWILCVVDRASLYNLVNKANLVHNFS
jgi:hypothetical protein